MICVLKMENGKPTGWILANDLHGVMEQAHAIRETPLIRLIETMTRDPSPDKYELNSPYSNPHYLMLVS